MPVKKRVGKRRTDPAAELERWEMYFRCGRDYFGDTGFPHGEAIPRPAARAAWKRLGSAFMATWKPEERRELPFAFTEFGDPQGRRTCQ